MSNSVRVISIKKIDIDSPSSSKSHQYSSHEELLVFLTLIEAVREDFQKKVSVIRQRVERSTDAHERTILVQKAEHLYDEYIDTLKRIELYINCL